MGPHDSFIDLPMAYVIIGSFWQLFSYIYKLVFLPIIFAIEL